MAVRVDRPGILWRDYHTVGAKVGIMCADRKIKKTASTGEYETMVTERFFLCDASFLVALGGPPDLLDAIESRLASPVWPPFLGRKCCPPSTRLFAGRGAYPSALQALREQPWRPRIEHIDPRPGSVRCVLECGPQEPGATLRRDCPLSFAEPRPMDFRYVSETTITGFPIGEPTQQPYKPPARNRMDYRSTSWRHKRLERGALDGFLCVFCKVPSLVTHHITYERARNENVKSDLRSVCRLCHDAITMLESEREMSLHRIDPTSDEYRDLILRKRAQIEAQRQRRYDPERR
jgi:hypothetical protein